MGKINVQEVFNKVIDSGIYDGNLMCFSLAEGVSRKVITDKEYLMAKEAIDKYLQGALTLGVALCNNRLPHTILDRIAIYKDWANRPKLTR